ncbi:hypothetical protein POM88_027535 [Heracleum sosnowskyi]|uniref:Transposase n=1 Tax=Heracleum sosnowskyi TaxID=360622 RepID=A0AAD8MPL5_9APIA|nr:hypothetical protein POM88_027535 [Heracleum sosnowskyi]
MDRHTWMYKISRATQEYIDGVEKFIQCAEENLKKKREHGKEDRITCPCHDCYNLKKYSSVATIREHLFRRGFMTGYTKWIWHGEGINSKKTRTSDGNRGTYGPDIPVTSYEGYDVNGYTFYTQCQDNKSTVQNIGVCVEASSTEFDRGKSITSRDIKKSYYGVIEEIWELDYKDFKVTLFRCKWFDDGRGVRVDESGFTLVDFSRFAYGPDIPVTSYEGYDVNGYTFYTQCQDNKSTVQNSGVCVEASSTEFDRGKSITSRDIKKSYYGVIEEIWELDYKDFKVTLFRCKWFDDGRGVRVDESGFTLVDFSRFGHVDALQE